MTVIDTGNTHGCAILVFYRYTCFIHRWYYSISTTRASWFLAYTSPC